MADIADLRDLLGAYVLNRQEYEKTSFHETQARIQFINRLFELLGWDVANRAGRYYPDVVHEYRFRHGDTIKAPDYAFMIGPARKFFVEAKAPHIDIDTDPLPARQLRLYAWSAKLTVSVLTNFRQIAIYDTRARPSDDDKPGTARLFFAEISDYESQWDHINDLISRDAVWGGSIDRLALSPVLPSTAPVDDAFLDELERWRRQLAHEVAKSPGLRIAQIRTATQLILDRLLFLRICEAKGLSVRSLKEVLSASEPYERFIDICRGVDRLYNSGLFHLAEEPGRNTAVDDVTPRLIIDGDLMRSIVEELYRAPYAFSALSVEIIGQAYERFLGSRIVRKGRSIDIETKLEVRKAGGVYYTPEYIVNYIVEQTIGADFNESTSLPSRPYRVLDPACGSGSFLLGAYKYLLNWYLNKYVTLAAENKLKNQDKYIYPLPLAEDNLFSRLDPRNWHLTITERKRILVEHIFGVDIDPQACEVTKLSLLLCCLENENAQTMGQQISLLQERVLPDLDANIKSGNSLISPDYFIGQPMRLLDLEAADDINAFDWKVGFQDAIKGGGFNCVIGNPPYVYVGDSAERDYMLAHCRYQSGKPDLYRIFIERATTLLAQEARFSYIVPTAFFDMPSAANLRRYLIDLGLAEVTFIDGSVFLQAGVNSSIFVVHRGREKTAITLCRDTSPLPSDTTLKSADCTSIAVQDVLSSGDARLSPGLLSVDGRAAQSWRGHSIPLSSIADYALGMQVYHNSIHSPDEIKKRIFHQTMPGLSFQAESNGRNVKRYQFIDRFVSYVRVTNRCYHSPAPEYFTGPRILIREILGNDSLVCCYTDSAHVSTKALIIVKCRNIDGWDTYGLLAVVNSRPIGRYIKSLAPKGAQRLFPRISLETVRTLPIPILADSEKKRLSDLGQRQVELAARPDFEGPTIKRMFESHDSEIDAIVSAGFEMEGSTKETA